MKKDPRVYLAQILERINRILEYTSEGKEAFFADPRTQDAVIRNFEVIGEAYPRGISAKATDNSLARTFRIPRYLNSPV